MLGDDEQVVVALLFPEMRRLEVAGMLVVYFKQQGF